MKKYLALVAVLLITLTGFDIDDLDTDIQDSAIATNLGLYGGQAADIAADPLSDTVYLTTGAPNGLFVSTDQGNSWSGLPADVNYGVGRDVTVDPDTGYAYATLGDTLLRSTDQGSTWKDITANVSTNLDNGLIADHGRLLVGLQTGQIAISDDNGDSFITVTVDSAVSIDYLAASPDAGIYYCLVTNNTDNTNALYSSNDVGLTWVNMDVTSNGMATGTSMWKVAANPTNGDNLVTTSGVLSSSNYLTTDGGATWTETVDDSGLAFDSAGRLYVGFNYTDNPTDSSPTWNIYASGTPLSSIYADKIEVDPDNVNIIFNNSGMGVAKSEDQGVSWEDSLDGVTSVKVYDISQTDDKVVVWLAANGGLARTVDFTASEPIWEYPLGIGTSNIHAVWVNPTDANQVVAGAGSALAYSIDGGDTWTAATHPEFTGTVYEILQSQVDANTLYASTTNYNLNGADSGMVLMSTDGGINWTDTTFTLPATSLTMASDDTLYAGVDGDSTPAIYSYDGSSWTSLTYPGASDEPVTHLLVHPENDDILFVTTPLALYKSTDAGSSWTEITDGIENLTNLDTIVAQTTTSPVTLYVTGQNGSTLNGVVYKSSDGGDTWGKYYEGLKQEQFYAMFFDGLMAGNDRGLYDIKSRANLKLNEKNQNNVTVSLSDAATAKKLKLKQIKLYRKQSGSWKKIESVRTNTKGKAIVRVNVADGTKLKAVWKPSGKDRREYANANSRVLVFNP